MWSSKLNLGEYLDLEVDEESVLSPPSNNFTGVLLYIGYVEGHCFSWAQEMGSDFVRIEP